MVMSIKKVFVILIVFLLLSSSVSAVITRYVNNVAEVSGGEVSCKINDRAGSQKVIINESGEVGVEFKSLPYG